MGYDDAACTLDGHDHRYDDGLDHVVRVGHDTGLTGRDSSAEFETSRIPRHFQHPRRFHRPSAPSSSVISRSPGLFWSGHPA